MTRNLKIGLGTSGVLGLFGLSSWSLGSLLGLHGPALWILRGGLLLIACIAAGVVAWILLHRPPAPAKTSADPSAEIAASLTGAGARLRAARRGALQDLPALLVLGDEGSAKTTVVVRSGLEPELLAGEAFRGDALAPTRLLNVWYSHERLFIEVGSKVLADPARWGHLVHQLRPRRMKAALTGARTPARAVVLCVSCEAFLRSDAAESVPNAARTLRSRLSELALQLGIRFPVYVVFTKVDRIPRLPDYVRNFSRDEVREVFGTTLPLDTAGPADYGERAFKRIDRAFQRLFQSLASKRLKYLPRENLPETAAGAYEFPREFRKIIPLAAQFLVEVCRPSQLEISPLLRGFYFVGVRPIVVTDAAVEQVARESATESVPIGATSVFHPDRVRAALAPKLTAAVQSSRKVPQWIFLERLFPQVVLDDRVALGVSRGGRRVHVLRRMLLGVAAAAALVAAVGFISSYRANRRLQDETAAVARGLDEASVGDRVLPTSDALTRLEDGRVQLQRLTEYERNGPPMGLRWGLYAGGPLYPVLHDKYFDAFERLLLRPTRDSLVGALGALPDTPGPGSDYGQTYTTLKAYLITTVRPEKSTVGFLAPALADRWHGSTPVDGGRLGLARRQFEFYADELRLANPYRVDQDGRAVSRGRNFLRQFAGTEPIYRAMLADVSSRVPALEFARRVPAAAGVVQDPYVVPGAFTKDGWSAMQAAFKNMDRFFKGEAWVVGDQGAVPADRDKIVGQLREQYAKEYIGHWRNFLAGASVARFSGVQEGVRRLEPLAGNQSPLLALFSIVSRNTAVDTLTVRPAFQPLHVVTPPGDTVKYIGAANEAYVNALVSLHASLGQVAKGPPEGGDAAVPQALNDASQAMLATKQIANKFEIDEVGKVHLTVQRLMEAPIAYAQASLQTVGPAQLNGKGQAFCAPFRQLMAKYPFNPDATVQAGFDELSALLQPGTGALWTFVEGELGGYIVRQGPQFAEKPGAPVRVSPSFVAFLNRAADFANTLYHEGAPPGLNLSLRPILSDEIPSLTLTVDGQVARFTRTSTAAKRITWLAGQGQEASLSGQVNGREQQLLAFQGTWAIFRLFNRAQWFPGDGFYSVEWVIPASAGGGASQRAIFNVNLVGAKPILQRDFFSGVSCSGRITR